LSISYSASTDPNHLLGRPNGYTSKAAFTDSRINPSEVTGDTTPGAVGFGGSVEVFPDASSAQDRGRYLETINKASPIFGSEYDYAAGPVLLRVSGILTPDQAAPYQSALGAIVGTPAQPVKAP
jgi:hypothetical protein